jgi:hypothetical protein
MKLTMQPLSRNRTLLLASIALAQTAHAQTQNLPAQIQPACVTALTQTQATTTSPRSSQPLSVDAYFVAMAKLLNYATNEGSGSSTPPTTARGQLELAETFYSEQLKATLNINPPKEAQFEHQNYAQAVACNVQAFSKAIARTPRNAPLEDYYKLYDNPEAGYAFGMETEAQCALARLANVLQVVNAASFPSRQACNTNPETRPSSRPAKTIGSPTEPMNNVVITHSPECVDPQSGRAQCPNLYYDVTVIHALSTLPIKFTFDNQNPLPFLFNLAVYDDNGSRLWGSKQLSNTLAGGPKRHDLTLNLQPGRYSYTDNVHPYSMRGTLIVH